MKIDVRVEVEKMYTILVNEKQDGYLASWEHLSKLMFSFGGDSYECDRREFEFSFENKKIYIVKIIFYIDVEHFNFNLLILDNKNKKWKLECVFVCLISLIFI